MGQWTENHKIELQSPKVNGTMILAATFTPRDVNFNPWEWLTMLLLKRCTNPTSILILPRKGPWVSSALVMTSHISGRRHVGKGVDIVTECRTRQQLNTVHQPSRSLLISNSSFRWENLVQSLSNEVWNISIFLWRENVSVIIMTTLGHDWENKTIVCQEYWQINNLLCLNFNLIQLLEGLAWMKCNDESGCHPPVSSKIENWSDPK